jgi:hypothetical protein
MMTWDFSSAPRPRLERGTYCLGGIPQTPSDVGPRGLTCRSAAAGLAGRGLVRALACGRWLPVWLPGNLISNANVRFNTYAGRGVAAPADDLTQLSQMRRRHRARTARSLGWRERQVLGHLQQGPNWLAPACML